MTKKGGETMKMKTNELWTIDELLKMLDCLKREQTARKDDLYAMGSIDGYNRALENIRFIVCIRKED